jgi:diguanylate cyclase (GGDEF)-like protein
LNNTGAMDARLLAWPSEVRPFKPISTRVHLDLINALMRGTTKGFVQLRQLPFIKFLQCRLMMNNQPPKLLIVDDIADNRTVLSRRFLRQGYAVVEADGGGAALDLIGRESFDAVLLDIVMPDLDGIEVLKRIRSLHTPSGLPVIMVTALTESADVVQALELGANDYVTKPVNFPVALARVSAQITRKHAEQALEDHVRKLEDTNRRLELEIAERKLSQARVQHLTKHDELTGLANRVVLREKLSRVLNEQGCASLLFIDIDDFKSVNETLGHTIGDEVLQALSVRLTNCAATTDTVIRWAADEFAILTLEAKGPDRAGHLASAVAESVSAPFEVHGSQIILSCSTGIAIVPTDGGDADTLLRNAEMAMRGAKVYARGKWRFFEPEMNERAQSRRVLERDLRTALAAGQLNLHFQPLLNLQHSAVSGFEALLRWNHPDRGMISPAEFIPVAEVAGLMPVLGRWVLHRACAEAARWPGMLRVAVNVSAAQFKTGGLGEEVFIALADSGLAPSRLELEITETALLDDDPSTVATLHHLRNMGVRVSMDDFGTGYSSLSYLRSFPFDKIKIDQSFIRTLTVQAESMAIVRAVTSLAKSLNIGTTAEGVETEEQLEMLRAEGCTEVQGFMISRPMASEDIAAFLNRHPPVKECA